MLGTSWQLVVVREKLEGDRLQREASKPLKRREWMAVQLHNIGVFPDIIYIQLYVILRAKPEESSWRYT